MAKEEAKSGKRKGKHPHKELSAIKVRQIKEPGRYVDGNGLYLVVDPSGAKRWVLRMTVHGKRRDIGLGGVSKVSLEEARERTLEAHKAAREGANPIEERKKAKREIPTFKKAAMQVHEALSPTWKNPKHVAQWINTLDEYAFPFIGDMRVDGIETPDVLKVLSPIWLTRPETARRVRQRIGVVLDWAKANHYRTGDNPVDGVAAGLPKQPKKEEHHAAMDYAEVPGFIKSMRKSDAYEVAKLAFEFLILTATRTNEVISAKLNEIDHKNKVWVIPKERMKAKREHRVPLSPRCLEILEQVKHLREKSDKNGYIFPSRTTGKPMNNMAFLLILRKMEIPVTAHGFRSSFRDWAAEETHFPNHVCEAALAHAIDDKTEKAYRRGDLFAKRTKLMEAWASYAAPVTKAKVIPMRAGRA